MARIILITGGARSGKSSYALDLAESFSDNRLFVATSPMVDPEMSERIRRHQQEREGRGWQTVEAELGLQEIFSTKGSKFQVILIDCITLWINNLLFEVEKSGEVLDDDGVASHCSQLLEIIRKRRGTIIFVTNEVGLGIVPENPLARRYRDLVGTANRIIAAEADDVTLITCGIPLVLKQMTV